MNFTNKKMYACFQHYEPIYLNLTQVFITNLEDAIKLVEILCKESKYILKPNSVVFDEKSLEVRWKFYLYSEKETELEDYFTIREIKWIGDIVLFE